MQCNRHVVCTCQPPLDGFLIKVNHAHEDTPIPAICVSRMARKHKMDRGKAKKARYIPGFESAYHAAAPGRKVGQSKPPFDWRKEFGLEDFDLPLPNLLRMCEDIYRARFTQLKYSEHPNAENLMLRTNDAIVAARAALDICPMAVA